MEKNVVTFILGGIVVILGVILVYQVVGGGLSGGSGIKGMMSEDEAGEFTIDYIKENFASPDTEMELLGVEEKNGVYEIKFKWTGEDQTAYVTKDGKYLFPQAYDMIPPEPVSIQKTDKPEVDLFVMSYCPFGNQAEELIMPVIDLLGADKVNVELHYIVYSDYATGYPDYCLDKANKYCSMHKIAELNQGIRELCVQKYDSSNFWNFVEQANTQATSNDIETKWQGIASSLGIDVNMVSDCQQNEGIALLDNELTLTGASYPVQDPSNHGGQSEDRISGSPAIVINGIIYDGARSADAYKDAICSAMNNPPAECEQSITSDAAPSGSCE